MSPSFQDDGAKMSRHRSRRRDGEAHRRLRSRIWRSGGRRPDSAQRRPIRCSSCDQARAAEVLYYYRRHGRWENSSELVLLCGWQRDRRWQKGGSKRVKVAASADLRLRGGSAGQRGAPGPRPRGAGHAARSLRRLPSGGYSKGTDRQRRDGGGRGPTSSRTRG